MSDEEYTLITHNKTQLPVEFKFKVVELWQETKNKIGIK